MRRVMDRERQIDFPPLQTQNPRVAPVMLALSIACIVIVVILLLAGVDGPFIGPWG
jgi:hypothetical protein